MKNRKLWNKNNAAKTSHKKANAVARARLQTRPA
jgi:hypothetical protein